MMGACSSHPFIHPILTLPPSSAAFSLQLHAQNEMEEELLAIFFFTLHLLSFVSSRHTQLA